MGYGGGCARRNPGGYSTARCLSHEASGSPVGVLAVLDAGDLDSVLDLGIEEDAEVAAAQAKASPRWLELFHVAGTARQVAIDTVENLDRCLAFDGPEFGSSFQRPADSDPFGRGLVAHPARFT